jgi:hypothetical protein
MSWELIGLPDFLRAFPEMSVCPNRSGDLLLRGKFNISAQTPSGPQINDTYSLEMKVPKNFPSDIPAITELETKIPRDGKHHTNPDNTLCLGSPIRLRKLIHAEPTLHGFAFNCLVPFLYGVSRKRLHPQDGFFMGELDHGEPGIVSDYKALFGLASRDQVIYALKLLGIKKRIANKRPCPCECGMRLGKCKTRLALNDFRKLAARSWFRKHAENPGRHAR